jgi:hypothetical protein
MAHSSAVVQLRELLGEVKLLAREYYLRFTKPVARPSQKR